MPFQMCEAARSQRLRLTIKVLEHKSGHELACLPACHRICGHRISSVHMLQRISDSSLYNWRSHQVSIACLLLGRYGVCLSRGRHAAWPACRSQQISDYPPETKGPKVLLWGFRASFHWPCLSSTVGRHLSFSTYDTLAMVEPLLQRCSCHGALPCTVLAILSTLRIGGVEGCSSPSWRAHNSARRK